MRARKITEEEIKNQLGNSYWGACSKIYYLESYGLYICGAPGYGRKYNQWSNNSGLVSCRDWVAVKSLRDALAIAKGACCGMSGPCQMYRIEHVHNTKRDLIKIIKERGGV
jgi:hypothetical protein